MLQSENKYKLAVQKLTDQQARFKQQRDAYIQSGLEADELERVLAPLRSFTLELKEEIADYESLKRGEFTELNGLRGIGTLLGRMRIASGMTQKELAVKLSVDPSLVSRDERNEYHGVTLDRAARIQEALGFELKSTVQPTTTRPIQSN